MSTALMASPIMDGDVETQTLKQLKVNLKDALRKSGVLNSVKAQIRREFIVGLSDKLPSKLNAQTSDNLDLRERLSLSVIYHFLQQRSFNHALSVFAAECGLESKSAWLSELDIVRSLQFGTHSAVCKQIIDKENKTVNVATDKTQKRNSVFDVLLNHLSSDTGRGVTEISVQTENSAHIRGPRESLEHQMQNLKTSFISRRDAERSSPTKSIEERMISFQRECEERYRRDSESYLNYMRETEISKVRLEEAQKARVETDILRKELESEYQRRIQEHSERESQSIRALSDRDRQMQQSQYEARQQMQREIDDLRGREKSGMRKLELESQGLGSLELRLKEVKAVLESREREVARREKMAEDLLGDNVERAKAEARSYVRSEMEEINREKCVLKLDRQHLLDVKLSQDVLIESANVTRSMLRDSQAELIMKEDEIAALQRKVTLLNEKLSRYPDDWEEEENEDPLRTGKNGRSLVSMLRHRNIQLEATLQAERNSEKEAEVERRVKEAEDSYLLQAEKLKSAMESHEAALSSSKQDNDILRRALHKEITALSAARLKNEEMSRLLTDQKVTIDSLMRRSTGASRSQGVKSSIDDLTLFLANRKKRELLSGPVSSSGKYAPYDPRGNYLYESQNIYGSGVYGMGPKDPMLGSIGSSAMPSYHPVTMEAYRARESQDREQYSPHGQQAQPHGQQTQPPYGQQTQQQQQYQQQLQQQQQHQQQQSERRYFDNIPITLPLHTGTTHTNPDINAHVSRGDSPPLAVFGDALKGPVPAHNPAPTSAPTSHTLAPTLAPIPVSHRYYVSASQGASSASPTPLSGTGRENDFSATISTLDDAYGRNIMSDKSEKISSEKSESEKSARDREIMKAAEESEKASLEMLKMKKDLEKQRLQMMQREEEWILDKENEEKERLLRRENSDLRERLRKERAAEEQSIIAAVKFAEENNKKEREKEDKEKDEKQIKDEKERIIKAENERVEKERKEERERINEMEEKDRKMQKDMERYAAEREEKQRIVDEEKTEEAKIKVESEYQSRRLKIIETAESSSKVESEEHSLTLPMASVTPKNYTLRGQSDFTDYDAVERDSLDAIYNDKKDVKENDKITDKNDDYDNQIDLKLRKNVPDTANYNKNNAVVNDDENNENELSAVNVRNVSTEWVSTIEHEEDSVGSSLLAPLTKDCTDGRTDHRQPDTHGGGKNLFDTVMENSTDSDPWFDEKKAEKEGEGGKDTKNQEILELDEDSDEEIEEENEEENEEEKERIEAERLAAETLAKEQEKKESDDKAIQDARASVIARRKQKSERDAVAASLSSLPVKQVEKISISVSASAPNAFKTAKYVTESSSDESAEVEAVNKSKSVIGLFDESMEIESVEEDGEASGDSSGASSW